MVQEHEDEEREDLARAARERAALLRSSGPPALYLASSVLSALLCVAAALVGIGLVDSAFSGETEALIIAGIVFVLFQALHLIYGMYLTVRILADIRSMP
jgi:hypothetical protein